MYEFDTKLRDPFRDTETFFFSQQESQQILELAHNLMVRVSPEPQEKYNESQ